MATAKAQGTSFVSRLTRPFVRLGSFLKDVHAELQRVVWPSHEETYSFTVVVIIAVGIVAVWVGVLDMLLTRIMMLLGVSQ